jgi:DNA polymerase III subunit delta'
MEGARTRGQPTAVRAVESMVRGVAPQAVVLVGPDGVGKTTLAFDLAAGLLCTAAVADRPCRACRACRLVDHGTHPDVHLLGPTGPGRQVVIGGADAKSRGVRDLIAELTLMPVEGGARVAIIETADRMHEDAQAALLKTLEEPPPDTTIILCVDEEARLLPTVRSRCARVRLGLVGARDIEAVLSDQGLADPPTAARLGRLAGGRPGIALAYAREPAAVLVRAELTRLLLDCTDLGPAARLAATRAAIPRAIELALTLATGDPPSSKAARAPAGSAQSPDVEADDDDSTGTRPRTPATDRRRGVELLLSLWADVARDLILIQSGGTRSVRDTVLIEESATIAAAVEVAEVVAFAERIARSAEQLAGNVSPELVLDSLVLSWPARRVAA